MDNKPSARGKFSKDDIKIAVRVRPLLERESRYSNVETIQIISEDTLLVTADSSPSMESKNIRKHFTYDYVFGTDSSQQAVYDTTTKAQLGSLLEGYNVSIFAYGVTGSGKTYS